MNRIKFIILLKYILQRETYFFFVEYEKKIFFILILFKINLF